MVIDHSVLDIGYPLLRSVLPILLEKGIILR